jgi:hypothetical protein
MRDERATAYVAAAGPGNVSFIASTGSTPAFMLDKHKVQIDDYGGRSPP